MTGAFYFLQDLENQMHIAEQRRRTLLKDFHDTWSSIVTAKHQHHHPPLSATSSYLLLLPSMSPLPLYLCFSSLSSFCFFLSFPPLAPKLLQGQRMARLYLSLLLTLSSSFTCFGFRASLWLHLSQFFTSDLITKVKVWGFAEFARTETFLFFRIKTIRKRSGSC